MSSWAKTLIKRGDAINEMRIKTIVAQVDPLCFISDIKLVTRTQFDERTT